MVTEMWAFHEVEQVQNTKTNPDSSQSGSPVHSDTLYIDSDNEKKKSTSIIWKITEV